MHLQPTVRSDLRSDLKQSPEDETTSMLSDSLLLSDAVSERVAKSAEPSFTSSMGSAAVVV